MMTAWTLHLTIAHKGFAAGICVQNGLAQASHFTYPPEYLQRYAAEALYENDHTMTHCLNNDGVFSWATLEELYGPSNAMLVIREFGILHGLCFSVSVAGEKSIASISLKTADLISEDIQQAIRDQMAEATKAVKRRIASSDQPLKQTHAIN